MLLPIFVFLYAAAQASAAVIVYGSGSTTGDSITCSSSHVSDSELAELMAIDLPLSTTMQDETTMVFDDPLVCGESTADGVVYACEGLDGTADCNPSSNNQRRSRNVKSLDRVLAARSNQLFKRKAYYCREYTQECLDTVDPRSLSGTCPSGYDTQHYSVKGHVKGTFCSRPCTEDQKAECLSGVCEHRTKQCQKSPSWESVCGDALVKCRTIHPVTMNQEICKNSLVTPTSTLYDRGDCADCVSYSDGQCYLDNDRFEAYLKSKRNVETINAYMMQPYYMQ